MADCPPAPAVDFQRALAVGFQLALVADYPPVLAVDFQQAPVVDFQPGLAEDCLQVPEADCLQALAVDFQLVQVADSRRALTTIGDACRVTDRWRVRARVPGLVNLVGWLYPSGKASPLPTCLTAATVHACAYRLKFMTRKFHAS